MGLTLSINDQAAFDVVIGVPGPAGQTGPQGPQGIQGTAATIVVGSVITVPSGQPATVTNAGTPSAAVFNFGLPQGVTGATGATGATGPAGQGVPTGGTAGQVLAKINGTNYNTEWIDPPDEFAVWGQITGSLSAQLDLASALAGKYSASNPSGFITSSALSPYLTQAAAASTYYPQTNPSGYITSGALTGYATQSWVQSGYAPIGHQVPAGGTTGQVLAKVSGSDWDADWTTIITGDRYLTTSTTTMTVSNGVKSFTVGTGLSYSPQQDIVIAYDGTAHMHAVVTSYNAGTGAMVADVQTHTGNGTHSSWTVNVGGITPQQSVAWGDITGTIGSQADLSAALNDKLDSTTAASTYYSLSNPSGFVDGTWVSGNFYPLSNPSGYIGDAPADGTTYGRNNGSWVAAGGSWNGGTVNNAIVVESTPSPSSNVTIDTAGLYAYDLGSGGSIGTTLDYAGFNNFSGSDYTNIAPGNLQVNSGGQNIQITGGAINFPDSTTQSTSATNYGFITDAPSDGTIYGRQNGSWVASPMFDGGTVNNSIIVWSSSSDYTTISPTQISVNSMTSGGLTTITGSGIIFSDSTSQTTAGIAGAPNDGNYYVFKNGAWVACTVVSMYNSNDSTNYNVLTVP